MRIPGFDELDAAMPRHNLVGRRWLDDAFSSCPPNALREPSLACEVIQLLWSDAPHSIRVQGGTAVDGRVEHVTNAIELAEMVAKRTVSLFRTWMRGQELEGQA